MLPHKINNHNHNTLHNSTFSNESNNDRIRIIFLIVLLTSSWIMTQVIQQYASGAKKIQEGVADKIIRFHVIANSDSKKDQDLKYRVKDTVIKELQPYFKDVNDIDTAREIIEEKLPQIENTASRVIEESGFNYPVSASFTNSYFPMKVYGDYTFPPGMYQALQIKIGKAEGKNWWCVMFPPLCFVDETYSIVTEDSEEKLEILLTEEELEELKKEDVPVKVKLKIIEAIKKLFS